MPTEQFPEGERPSSISMSSMQHNPDEAGVLGLSRSLAGSHNPKQEEGDAEEKGAANGAGGDDDDSSDSGSSDGSLPEMRCSLSSSAAAMQLRQAQSHRFIQLRRQPSLPPQGFTVRVMRGDEVEAVAQICADAFGEQNKNTGLADEYPDGPPVDFFAYSHAHPDIVTVVACDPEGQLAGTNTVDLRATVAGIGPIAVAPAWWDQKLGRFLMNGAMEHAKQRGKGCVMLQQVNNNVKSYALYARMGFVPVETCLSLEGFVYEHLEPDPRYDFRRLGPGDVQACEAMYQRLFPGFGREAETRDAIEDGLKAAAQGDEGVATFCLTRRRREEGDGEEELAAFTTGLDLHGYVLAEDREAYKALLTHCSHHLRRQQEAGGATGKTGSGGIAFHLLADQYPDLLDWVFNEARLKIMEVTTLMAFGEPCPRIPQGSKMIYSPSVTH